MSDITEAIEQDAIADTLVAPLESTYDDQHAGTDYRYADGEEGVDFAQEEQTGEEDQQPDEAEQLDPDEGQEELAATPEERAEYVQGLREWDAMPAEQRGQRADQWSDQAYAEAYNDISPREAQTFTKNFCEAVGQPQLVGIVNPQGFAAYVHAWDQNLEQTVARHPDGPEFLKALGDTQHPEKAYQAVSKLCDPTMAKLLLDHFAMVVGNRDVIRGVDPMQFAAGWALELARQHGWGQQSASPSQRGRAGGKLPWTTNRDLFDESVMAYNRPL
jgi:hypothetical protein